MKQIKCLLAIMAFALPAQADDNSWEYFKNVTVMNLSASARETVSQDKLTATLRIEYEAKTAEEVQAYINTKMAAALKAANTVTSVKAKTGHYSVRKEMPYNQKMSLTEKKRRTIWLGNQTIILDGFDKKGVLKIAGTLQKMGYSLNGLNYYLSKEKSEKYQEQLIEEAVATVQKKARKLAKQLGMPKVHFANVSFGNSGYRPPRKYMARAAMAMPMDAAEMMPEPVAQAGESDITVNVNVEVHLSR